MSSIIFQYNVGPILPVNASPSFIIFRLIQQYIVIVVSMLKNRPFNIRARVYFFHGAQSKNQIIYFFNINKSAILLQILLTHVSLKSTVSDELFLTYFGSIYFLATYSFFSEKKNHALSHQRSVIYTPPSRVSSYYQNAVMFVQKQSLCMQNV